MKAAGYIFWVGWLLCGSVLAQESPQTGRFTLSQPTDITVFQEVLSKDDYGLSGELKDKMPAEVSWHIYVPKNYDPARPPGIFYFINSGDSGNTPGFVPELMERHNLIWVGGNKAGNKVPIFIRISFALQGVAEIESRYKIDDNRIYLSGTSGGGRTASIGAVRHADRFDGAVYFIGCNPWEDIAFEKEDGKRYITSGFLGSKKPELLDLIRQNRYAFVSGTKDYNLPGTKLVHELYQDSGVEIAELIIEEGLAHRLPSAPSWEKAFEVLDRPLAAQAEQFFKQAEAHAQRRQVAEAIPLYQRAAAYRNAAATGKLEALRSEADKHLATAKEKEATDPLAAYQLYRKLVAYFGEGFTGEAVSRIQEMRADPELAKEAKAAAFLQRIGQAFRAGQATPEQVREGLQKVIDACPGTPTAARAEELMGRVGS